MRASRKASAPTATVLVVLLLTVVAVACTAIAGLKAVPPGEPDAAAEAGQSSSASSASGSAGSAGSVSGSSAGSVSAATSSSTSSSTEGDAGCGDQCCNDLQKCCSALTQLKADAGLVNACDGIVSADHNDACKLALAATGATAFCTMLSSSSSSSSSESGSESSASTASSSSASASKSSSSQSYDSDDAGPPCQTNAQCAAGASCCVEARNGNDQAVKIDGGVIGVCVSNTTGHRCDDLDAGTGFWVRVCGEPTDCTSNEVCCAYPQPPYVCETVPNCLANQQFCGGATFCVKPEACCNPDDAGFHCVLTLDGGYCPSS